MSRARGFMLIEVLLALTVLAVAFAAAVGAGDATVHAPSPQPLSLRQVGDLMARAHADSLARAAAERAAAILAEDDPGVDHPGEPWAQALPKRLPGDATLTGAIVDEQAKFNLNNLTRGEAPGPADVAALQRLLELVGLPGSLADAIVDWLDPDDAATQPAAPASGGPHAREPPSRAMRRAIVDVRELAQVKGMTPEALARLAPHVTALPEETPVNANTASATVLRALVPALSHADAARLVEARGRAPFRHRDALLRALPGAAATTSIDVRSRFFSAEATAHVGRVTIGYRALIERGERRRAVVVRLWQTVP